MSNWTPELDAKVETMAAKGLSMKKIGVAVGLTKNQIIGRRWRNRHSRPTPEYQLSALQAKIDLLQTRIDAARAKMRALEARQADAS
jgi:hypothetical protein